jgi:hypothetical protein
MPRTLSPTSPRLTASKLVAARRLVLAQAQAHALVRMLRRRPGHAPPRRPAPAPASMLLLAVVRMQTLARALVLAYTRVVARPSGLAAPMLVQVRTSGLSVRTLVLGRTAGLALVPARMLLLAVVRMQTLARAPVLVLVQRPVLVLVLRPVPTLVLRPVLTLVLMPVQRPGRALVLVGMPMLALVLPTARTGRVSGMCWRFGGGLMLRG